MGNQIQLSGEQKNTRIAEIEFSLSAIDQAIQYLTRLVEAEGTNAYASLDELNEEVAKATFELEAVAAKIDEQKTLILSCKELIRNKKKGYEAIADEFKKDNWSILTEDMGTEHQQIVSAQALIGELEKEKFASYQYLNLLSQQIHAAGIDKSGIDPRLAAAIAEQQRLWDELNTLKK